MGNHCSAHGHAYKLTHKTDPLTRPNDIANYFGLNSTIYLQCFQYDCINCGKTKCYMVHRNIMDAFPDGIDYDITEHDMHGSPTQCLHKLSARWPNAQWIPVNEGWIQ